mmetsp:Transcript_77261/g.94738  ORF Transcript_77261/g.94738 Transcript_77261/m.94738 type:complete len:376 (+) Transcript_77261:47-1174(+)
MTNSNLIESNILSSSFCLTNATGNNVFSIYFRIFAPVSLLIMFVSMKYGVKLKMLGFCSILSLLIETVTISSILGGITYSLVLWGHTSKFVDYNCSFYAYYFAGSQLIFDVFTDSWLLNINALYIVSILVGLTIFTVILVLKLKLMKIAQEIDEEFEKHYNKEGYSCKQQCCRWLAAKIKYQWEKFWETGRKMLLIKIFLFITGFSLCASLQPLYSIGNAYDEDYSKAANENCLCIEKGIGTAISLYGSAITAMIALPVFACAAYIFHRFCYKIAVEMDDEVNASNVDDGQKGASCCIRGTVELILWWLIITAVGLAFFVIASPFLMIYTRGVDMYESTFISTETGGVLSVSQVITSIFFIEMLVHAFNDCGCRC